MLIVHLQAYTVYTVRYQWCMTQILAHNFLHYMEMGDSCNILSWLIWVPRGKVLWALRRWCVAVIYEYKTNGFMAFVILIFFACVTSILCQYTMHIGLGRLKILSIHVHCIMACICRFKEFGLWRMWNRDRLWNSDHMTRSTLE